MTSPAARRALVLTGAALAALCVGVLATASDMLPLTAAEKTHQLVFLLALGIGVALLLVVAWTRVPLTVAGWGVVVGAGLAGTALSILITRETACCMFSLTVHEGYPFPVRSHNVVQDTYLSPAELHRYLRETPGAFSHRTDPLGLMADTVFWASLALACVVPVRWIMRRRDAPRRPPVPAVPAGRH